jgi:hypothetical protein
MAYKDSLFRSIFSSKKSLLGLYNALFKTELTEKDIEIELNTLSENHWTMQKNDLSFKVGEELIVTGEHQSSINLNMPFRCLQIICRLFENTILNKSAIYQKTLIKFPRPIFIVFYNGKQPFPAYTELKLSDALKKVKGFEGINIELIVMVYNINAGFNEDMVGRSEELKGYVFLVETVRKYEAEEKERGNENALSTAISRGLNECRRLGYLKDFLDNLTGEEELMLITEWNWETAVEVRGEERYEEGFFEGAQKGREEGE